MASVIPCCVLLCVLDCCNTRYSVSSVLLREQLAYLCVKPIDVPLETLLDILRRPNNIPQPQRSCYRNNVNAKTLAMARVKVGTHAQAAKVSHNNIEDARVQLFIHCAP